MKMKYLAAAIAATSAIGVACAADLVTVYRDALVSDPVFQSARAQYQAGVEKLPQARAGYLPLITGGASTTKNDIGRDIAPDLNYRVDTYFVSLSQPLFRMQNWISISQAEQQLLQNAATLETAKQDLILRVAQAYFDVLLAQDNVQLSGAQKTSISEQLAQAKRNFEVGTATIVDTLEAQARFDQGVAKEIADVNDLEVKKRALQQLVGKVVDGLVPLKDKLVLAAPRPNDIEAWVSAASESSFSIAFFRGAFEIAKREVDRAKAGHLPTLDLNAGYSWNRNPSQVIPGQLGPVTDGTSIGLTLSVPIFAGGLTQSRVREAVANRDRAEQDLENSRRSVAQLVRQNYLFVTNGISGVLALERAQDSTQSQLDSTILGRDVGVRTSVDVLNAQQQFFQTRRDLLQQRYNFLLNTLRLKASAGRLSEPDLEEVNRALGRG
jgi:outer membrane protein